MALDDGWTTGRRHILYMVSDRTGSALQQTQFLRHIYSSSLDFMTVSDYSSCFWSLRRSVLHVSVPRKFAIQVQGLSFYSNTPLNWSMHTCELCLSYPVLSTESSKPSILLGPGQIVSGSWHMWLPIWPDRSQQCIHRQSRKDLVGHG